jgi:three-Cys-motif partner protein
VTDGFFVEKRAAAVFKHAILNQYVDPFAMKTGSTSPKGRVAFVDGYAGEGVYDDGTEGSPALLIAKANKLAGKRALEIHLVEEDAVTFAKLDALVDVAAKGLEVKTYEGDAAQHLDTLLAKASDIPIFVFLDPYGLMIPFDVAAKILNSRPSGLGAPATEVLINFTGTGLRRIAGHLYSETPNAATLGRIDAVCGGDWWQAAWLHRAPTKAASKEAKLAAEEAIVAGYAQRLGKATGAGHWTSEARNEAHQMPIYYLVFLTRHRDGLHVFGESLSLATTAWRRTLWTKHNVGSLFEGEEAFKANEAALAAQWIDEIEKNLLHCLVKYGALRVRDHYAEVVGSTVGKTRETHLRASWNRLYKAGVTKTDSNGNKKPLVDKLIEPATTAAPA